MAKTIKVAKADRINNWMKPTTEKRHASPVPKPLSLPKPTPNEIIFRQINSTTKQQGTTSMIQPKGNGFRLIPLEVLANMPVEIAKNNRQSKLRWGGERQQTSDKKTSNKQQRQQATNNNKQQQQQQRHFCLQLIVGWGGASRGRGVCSKRNHGHCFYWVEFMF